MKMDDKINESINKFLSTQGHSILSFPIPEQLNQCYPMSMRQLPEPVSSLVRGNLSLWQNSFDDLSHWKNLPTVEQVDDKERMHSMMFPIKRTHD